MATMNSTAVKPAPVSTEAETEKKVTQRKLNRLDRCDQCSAQAYLLAISTTTGLELLFCRHHGMKNMEGLVLSGFELDMQDQELFANTKPDGGSAAG